MMLYEKKLLEYKSTRTIGKDTYQIVTDSVRVEASNRKINLETWQKFELLLAEYKFGSMPTTVAEGLGCDGSEWILEKHSPEGYYVVNRWSPGEHQYTSFRKICDYLIDISKYKEERRY